MKNLLLSTTSGCINAFTSNTARSCSNWLNSLKAGHSFWLVLFLVSLAGVSSPGLVLGQSADLDQIRNGSSTGQIDPPSWVNGSANATQAHYLEGHSIAYRMIVDGLGTNSAMEHTLVIAYDHLKGAKHALDFMTHYQNLEPHNMNVGGPFNHDAENIKPLLGLTGVSNDSIALTIIAPAPLNASALATFNALPAGKKEMMMYGGGVGASITALTPASYSYAGEETQLVIKFHSSNNKVVFVWGGHIATSTDWGVGNSAVFIPGSPYHTRLISIDGKGGNQDRALQSAAVTPINPPTCAVNGDDILCNGSSGSYAAISDGTQTGYFWEFTDIVLKSGGSVNPTFTFPSSGSTVSGATADAVTVDPGDAVSFKVKVTISKTGAQSTSCDFAVIVEYVEADAGGPYELTCTNSSGQLDGTSNGASFLWTVDPVGAGTFDDATLLDPVFTFNAGFTSATLRLTATGANGCTAFEDVAISEDKAKPSVDAGGPYEITCTNSSGQLDGTSDGVSFLWTVDPVGAGTFDDATLLDPVFTFNAGFTSATLRLTATGANGCTDFEDVAISEDKAKPSVDAGGPYEITCTNSSGQLDGTSDGVSFLWTVDPVGAGTFDDATLLDPVFTFNAGFTSATLRLTATGANGCTDFEDVAISEDKAKPSVDAGGPYEITCTNSSGQLDGTSDGVSFLWTVDPVGAGTFDDATLLDPVFTFNAGFTSATLRLTATGANGCTDFEDVAISEDKAKPSVDAGGPYEITCTNSSGQLDGTSDGVSFLWTVDPVGAGTFDDATLLDPVFTFNAGFTSATLRLTATGANGCTDFEDVAISEDKAKPDVSAGGDKQIACGAGTVVLEGSSSTQGATYLWTTLNGNIVSDETTLTPTVSAAGTYTLTVTGTNGCTESDEADVTIQVCGDKHCTLTQGAYGNANGKFCGGPRRLELINNLLGQNGLTIGFGTRTIIYGSGDAECIIKTMPAGGTAAALPASFVNEDGCNYTSSGIGAVLAKNGRFNNVFIGQVLALSLNSRLDATLGSVVLTSTMTTYKASDCGPNATPILNNVMSRTIPQSVLTYLGANATVAGLLDLANKALGGVTGLPSISDINAAVSAINEVFDECRILANAPQLAINNPLARTEGKGGVSISSDKFVKAYPNPFTDKATIEFMTAEDLRYSLEMYDINGRLVSRLSEGTTQAGKAYNFEITAGNLPEGVYLVRFITDRYIETLKVIYKK